MGHGDGPAAFVELVVVGLAHGEQVRQHRRAAVGEPDDVMHPALRERDGHAVAWLEVMERNARARRFYEREGWRDTGPLTGIAETPAGTFDIAARRYEKPSTAV